MIPPHNKVGVIISILQRRKPKQRPSDLPKVKPQEEAKPEFKPDRLTQHYATDTCKMFVLAPEHAFPCLDLSQDF